MYVIHFFLLDQFQFCTSVYFTHTHTPRASSIWIFAYITDGDANVRFACIWPILLSHHKHLITANYQCGSVMDWENDFVKFSVVLVVKSYECSCCEGELQFRWAHNKCTIFYFPFIIRVVAEIQMNVCGVCMRSYACDCLSVSLHCKKNSLSA